MSEYITYEYGEVIPITTSSNNLNNLEGQLFPCDSRVSILDNLDESMSHFPQGVNATVLLTYAHLCGGSCVTMYKLDVDGYGVNSWYYEHQLKELHS